MRRKHREEGSMELLLDTICNVFGGIVFIAILVALLTTARTSEVERVPEQTAADVELVREYEQLADRRESYAASLAQLEATQQVLAEGQDAEQRRELVESITRLTRELSEAEAALADHEAWLEQAELARAEHAAAVEEALDEAEAMLAELETARAELEQRHSHDARLHMERRTRKRQVIFMLIDEVAYIVAGGGYGAAVERAGVERHVRMRPIDAHSHRVEPIAGQGMPTDAIADHPDLQRLVDELSPRSYFFDIFVFDDSVAAYEALRHAAVAAGFEYNVTPATDPILTTTRHPRPVQ